MTHHLALRPLAVAALFATQVSAADLEPVVLPALAHAAASLEIRDADGGVAVYSPADLETFPTFRLVTVTPWRSVPARFEGARLIDLLRHHGLDGADAIRVIAENEFVSIVEREVWETVEILVATRVDGAAHSRRARGPIQFVVDAQTYAAEAVIREGHLVWGVAVIEPAD